MNPSERRQRVALFACAILLAAGMIVGAIALAPGHARVPNLHGMTRSRAATRAHHDRLQAQFGHRYSAAARGTVIGQSPKPGTRVTDGTTVRLTLSAGPAPVPVPNVTGDSASNAQVALGAIRLHSAVSQVSAPGNHGFITALMTAFYMGRLVVLTFFSKPRMSHEVEHHIHESPKSMTIPLVILAFFSIFAGWLGLPHSLGGSDRFAKFLEPVFAREEQVLQAEEPTKFAAAEKEQEHTSPMEYGLMALSVAAAFAGLGMAWKAYNRSDKGYTEPIATAAPPVYDLLYNKYYVDEAYDYAFTGRRKVGDVRLGDDGTGRGVVLVRLPRDRRHRQCGRMDDAPRGHAFELVGQVDHRRPAGQWAGRLVTHNFVPSSYSSVGFGAVVRAGDGVRPGRICRLLRLAMMVFGRDVVCCLRD